MTRSILMGVLGFSMALGGCTQRDRAERHEQSARDELREASEARNKAAEKAKDEMQKANEARAKGMQEAKEEQAKAEHKAGEQVEDAREARAKGEQEAREHIKEAREEMREAKQERTMVAGRDETGSPLAKQLQEELGNDWVVERSGASFLATRKQPKQAVDGLAAKLDHEIKELRKDHPDVSASYRRDEVTLRGRLEKCGDAAKAVDEFSDIDGINRIVANITCAAK